MHVSGGGKCFAFTSTWGLFPLSISRDVDWTARCVVSCSYEEITRPDRIDAFSRPQNLETQFRRTLAFVTQATVC